MGQSGTLAIIVAYNNTEELGHALASLDGECDALVVDNGAHQAAQRMARQHMAEYITVGRNVGFAAAVNLGLRRRDGRDVLLLNPDARISSPTLSALARELRADETLCAVAPTLLGNDGERERVEWPIPSPREEWVKAFRLQRLMPPRRTFLIGAVLLLRDEALVDVGEFDERFFLYAEECDWQLRAQLRGWKVRIVEDAVAVHAGGGSSEVESKREQLFRKSAELFALKWYGRTGSRSMRVAYRTGAGLRLLLTMSSQGRRAQYARQLRL